MDDNFVNVAGYLDEIGSYMPHFVFYRRGMRTPALGYCGEYLQEEYDRKVTDCYCTACHERYEDGIRKPTEYNHKEISTCIHCGATVELRQMNRGRSTYYLTRNFAVFEGAGDQVRISCIKAIQKFEEDEFEPVLMWDTITKYQLQPGKAIQYKPVWISDYHNKHWEWQPKKSKAKEPNFAGSFGYYYRDNSYTIINHASIENSFLKYLWKYGEEASEMYITWLCRYAEHQQIEYFLHGGLSKIAVNLVHAGLGKAVRLNWRSNDLKKILKLSKAEINYMKESEGARYCHYIIFRRDIFKGKTDTETIKYFDNFYNSGGLLTECSELSKLSIKQIMDYCLKRKNEQGTYYFMISYRDYLNECIKLKYNMKSEIVIMPKDLFAAHERTAKILSNLKNEALNNLLREIDEKRKDLEVVDMELGLQTMLPTCMHDIAQEGARLNHCVGGYADRHAHGATNIIFLRTLSRPQTSYYTIEVSSELKIMQCHGKDNDRLKPKSEIILEFEKRYAIYLEAVKAERKRQERKRNTKSKKKHQKAKTAA